MPVLERGMPTPPGTLVFAPVDGRRMGVLPPYLDPYVLDKIQAQSVRRAVEPRGAAWVLVPCLVALRAEFNIAGPRRDKSSDGSIGDTAHASSSSDHNPDETGATPYEDSDRINEVHAIDVDDSGPWEPGFDFDDAVEGIRLRHQRGEDDRLQNIIRNGRIASRSWGWDWRAYTGANAHREHCHFSARYTTEQESDTSPWGLADQEDDMTSKAEFIGWLKDKDVREALAAAVHLTDGVLLAPEGATNADGTPNTHWAGFSYLAKTYAAAVNGRGYAAEARTAGNALLPQVATLIAYAKTEAGEVPPTAQQIAELVVSGLVDEPVTESAAAILAMLGPVKAAALAEAIRALTPAK